MSIEKPPDTEKNSEKGQSKISDSVKQSAINDQSQNTEFEIASKTGQDFTSMTELKVPSAGEIQQFGQSSFAIVGDEGSEVASSKIKLAQNVDGNAEKKTLLFKLGGEDLEQEIPKNMPTLDSAGVIENAKNLLNDKHRWKGPMCNIFADTVLRGARVPLPWTESEDHSCTAMVKKLSQDPRFELVWQRGDGDLNSKKQWKSFQAHDVDIAIWSNKHLVHVGILESAVNNEKNILYAGASNETGANYTNADYFVNSSTKGYGPPDYVFRYRGFEKK